MVMKKREWYQIAGGLSNSENIFCCHDWTTTQDKKKKKKKLHGNEMIRCNFEILLHETYNTICYS